MYFIINLSFSIYSTSFVFSTPYITVLVLIKAPQSLHTYACKSGSFLVRSKFLREHLGHLPKKLFSFIVYHLVFYSTNWRMKINISFKLNSLFTEVNSFAISVFNFVMLSIYTTLIYRSIKDYIKLVVVSTMNCKVLSRGFPLFSIYPNINTNLY